MGSKAKRKAIAKFITTGKFDGGDGLESTTDIVADGPLDPAWLADIKAQRARLATDPANEILLYRAFFKNPSLTAAEMDQLFEQMENAIGTPEKFFDELDEATSQEGIGSSVAQGLGCAIKIPRFFPTRGVSDAQEASLARLRADFDLGNDIEINPNEHHFEFCDPGWWPLLRQGVFDVTWWPKGLAPYIMDQPPQTFVYNDQRQTKQVALMADFGVGHYHSWFIAKQLAAKAYPYVFHLGDVYYGGTEDEFARNYSAPLDQVMNKSLLFSMPENHELYGHGYAWINFISREHARGRIIQEGSYFCVRFPEHQIIGIDVNWNGRQRFTHDLSRHWLRQVLFQGKDLTTILLTGSAPYVYGENKSTQLFDDLAEWHSLGLFHLWFWGDDHYCALFDRTDKARFVGSCIGHAGYPGDIQADGRPTFAPTRWVETEPRFPAGYGLRDDLTNNGWVELSLVPGGGVELVYVDWLGCKRLRAHYDMDATDPLHRYLKLAGNPDRFPRTK